MAVRWRLVTGSRSKDRRIRRGTVADGVQLAPDGGRREHHARLAALAVGGHLAGVAAFAQVAPPTAPLKVPVPASWAEHSQRLAGARWGSEGARNARGLSVGTHHGNALPSRATAAG
jgi:hypothetical protein